VRRRCGLMSNYFDHLLLLDRMAVLYVRKCGLLSTDRVAWSAGLSTRSTVGL